MLGSYSPCLLYVSESTLALRGAHKSNLHLLALMLKGDLTRLFSERNHPIMDLCPERSLTQDFWSYLAIVCLNGSSAPVDGRLAGVSLSGARDFAPNVARRR